VKADGTFQFILRIGLYPGDLRHIYWSWWDEHDKSRF